MQTPSRRRVLVVDDEALVGEVIAAMLSPGHEVQVMTTGRGAINCIAEGQRFDAIVCDLMMPGATGMDVYKAIMASAPEQAARMVFITGGTFREDAARFLDGISNAWIQKPFDRRGILALLEGICGQA